MANPRGANEFQRARRKLIRMCQTMGVPARIDDYKDLASFSVRYVEGGQEQQCIIFMEQLLDGQYAGVYEKLRRLINPGWTFNVDEFISKCDPLCVAGVSRLH